MKLLVIAALMMLTVAACTSTHERPMNKGEKTIVSDKVAHMVDAKGGTLDIRDEDDVVCDRIKLTGSHMVTRICYTRAEKRAMEAANQDKTRDRFTKLPCHLDGRPCTGLTADEPPRPIN